MAHVLKATECVFLVAIGAQETKSGRESVACSSRAKTKMTTGRCLSLPGVVDKYTTTENYEYLLEMDEHNTIIGGEWVGETRYKHHPDFLWFALDQPADGFVTPTGIRYAFVKELIRLSREANC